MAISGVGTVYNYNYNLVSKRISGTDGKNDEFVQYCNGELKGEDSAELNGYDYRTKGVINGFMERMQWLYDAGLMDKPVADPETEDIELSCEIEDITTTSIYVNREKRLTAIVPGVVYTGDEIRSFATVAPPFKTKVHQDYNPSDNSIHIAVGDKFSYGNGYTLTVGETKVMGDGYDGKSDAENQAVDRFSWALNSLLHFADQQYISDMIDKDMTPQILSFLQEQGVDTSREFTINETRCEVRDGRIREVGNKTGIPNSIYNKALARYEESLEAPLNKAGRVYDRTSMEKNDGVESISNERTDEAYGQVRSDKPLWDWHDGQRGYFANVYKNEGSDSEYTVKLTYDDGREAIKVIDADKVDASSCGFLELSIKMYHLRDQGKISDSDAAANIALADVYMRYRMPNADENTLIDFKGWYERQLELEMNDERNEKHISSLMNLLKYL